MNMYKYIEVGDIVINESLSEFIIDNMVEDESKNFPIFATPLYLAVKNLKDITSYTKEGQVYTHTKCWRDIATKIEKYNSNNDKKYAITNFFNISSARLEKEIVLTKSTDFKIEESIPCEKKISGYVFGKNNEISLHIIKDKRKRLDIVWEILSKIEKFKQRI